MGGAVAGLLGSLPGVMGRRIECCVAIVDGQARAAGGYRGLLHRPPGRGNLRTRRAGRAHDGLSARLPRRAIEGGTAPEKGVSPGKPLSRWHVMLLDRQSQIDAGRHVLRLARGLLRLGEFPQNAFLFGKGWNAFPAVGSCRGARRTAAMPWRASTSANAGIADRICCSKIGPKPFSSIAPNRGSMVARSSSTFSPGRLPVLMKRRF